jgi:putative thioredoxin
MAPGVDHVVNVADGEFISSVLGRSHQVPVVAYVWAPWCGPCSTIGPMLERVAEELSGGFVLAKIDVAANPQLGEEFGIRGVPLLMLYRDGECLTEVADLWAGAGGIRSLLREHFDLPGEPQ